MESRRALGELSFRVKLVGGLALLGGVVGGLLFLRFGIFSGEPQTIDRLARAAWAIMTDDRLLGARRLLWLSVGGGAGLLAGPVLLFFVRRQAVSFLKLFLKNGGLK